MIPLNFSHLFYFYTIAKEGSVLKAGQVLRLAQPTLSTQLKQFEDFLGKQLFERTGRRLVLTETGHYVLSYAKTIFDAGRECVSGLQDFNAKSPVQIQIGVTPFIPKAIIDALLNFVLKSEHNIHLRVIKDRIETLLQNLGDNFLDVALTDTPSPASAEMHLDHHLICTIPVVFCAHSSLARKIKNFPKDLNGMPMILPTAQSHIYHAILEYLRRHKVTPRIIAEIQDVELVRRLALAGHGIAPMNQFTALNAPTKKKLVILDRKVSHSILDRIYLLIKKKQRTNPLVQKVIQDFKLSSFS